MSAPAEIPRLIKAIVLSSVSRIISLISMAASTRPPNVSMSKIIAAASASSASLTARSTKLARPRSTTKICPS